MDGGVAWNTNLVSAVERCREMVDDDSEIVLDIINCDSHKLATWKKIDEKNTFANLLRF